MASEFENIHDLDDLNDRELRDLVRSHLRAHNGLDADYITVRTEEGAVILEGRVGTERHALRHCLSPAGAIPPNRPRWRRSPVASSPPRSRRGR